MKIFLLFGFMLMGCQPTEQKVVTEDYVLVEFASKLEEDYHRFEKEK